jgi:hypothetical protein
MGVEKGASWLLTSWTSMCRWTFLTSVKSSVPSQPSLLTCLPTTRLCLASPISSRLSLQIEYRGADHALGD